MSDVYDGLRLRNNGLIIQVIALPQITATAIATTGYLVTHHYLKSYRRSHFLKLQILMYSFINPIMTFVIFSPLKRVRVC
ncbi:MAG: hypothetical protein V7K89_24655 [Nostoc sp.]|uniref:hypothetical protein n=1 Tax=Nostoc sp. TaxID=1180 RepID=UPI002FF49578